MTEQPLDEPRPVGTLVVLCRRPRPGVGKRRIAADLGDSRTAELAGLLLETALEDAVSWPGEVILSPSEAADSAWAAQLLERPVRVVAQPADENLGRRILEVDQEVRAGGARDVVYIGSDAPGLDSEYLREASHALARHDVVLGPAADGGVTLMASRCPWPQELLTLPWSTSALGAALEEACRAAGHSVSRLAERSDVDLVADLARLRETLASDVRPARGRLVAWLDALGPLDVETGRGQKISIIIPVFGDLTELERLLESLGRPPGAEVIVVDGQGDPACRAACEAAGALYQATRAGRGHQLTVGAGRATGQILWFLHADSEPPVEALDALRHAVREGAAGGFLRFRFSGPRSFAKRFLERFIALRNRGGGVPYGDQGLFFARDAYEAAGGFVDEPLFEEVPLVRAVRRTSGPNGFVALPQAIGVSSRRWERDGWIRRTVENRLLALGYMLGVPPRVLANRYRETGRRSEGGEQ